MAVSKKKKIIIATVVILLLAAIIGASVFARRGDLPEVQTAKVERRAQLESKVTANGEVRPIQFINLTAEVPGRVIEVYVQEGTLVRQGQPLLKIDKIQQESQMEIQKAGLGASRADVENQQAALNASVNAKITARAARSTAEADLARAKADQTRAEVDQANAEIEFKRNEKLVEAAIVSQSVFDSAKARLKAAEASVEASKASVRAAEARVAQAEAQEKDADFRANQSTASLNASKARVAQSVASLKSQNNLLDKTTQKATINGVVVGPLVQVGTYALANFSSTPLMIIADMSVINVEVRVDESDIRNVKVHQKVKVKVDAIGDKPIEGEVIEIAQSAVTRTGQTIAATAVAASNEAKDFKVVIRITDNRQEVRDYLRPGMSATATINTDRRENAVAVPLQALVERDSSETKGDAKTAASPTPGQDKAKDKKPIKGVFVVKDNKTIFTKVETGITGDNDIEITSGLNPGEEIVIGPYRQLRSLKDNTAIKREDKNKKPGGKDDTSK